MTKPTVLMGLTEIAEALGLSRGRVNNITRQHADFPPPIAELAQGRVWDAETVREWAAEHSRPWREPSSAGAATP